MCLFRSTVVLTFTSCTFSKKKLKIAYFAHCEMWGGYASLFLRPIVHLVKSNFAILGLRKKMGIPFWWRSPGISSVIRRSRMSRMRWIRSWWATITWTRRWRVSISWVFHFLHGVSWRVVHIAMLPGHWRSRICHFSATCQSATNHCKTKRKEEMRKLLPKGIAKKSSSEIY